MPNKSLQPTPAPLRSAGAAKLGRWAVDEKMIGFLFLVLSSEV